MKRTEKVELLFRVSKSLDFKETLFKQRLYNFILATLNTIVCDKKEQNPIILSNAIIEEVGIFYMVSEDYYHVKNRKRELVQARQIAMVLIKENTKLSMEFIANMFGGRDHSTFVHAKKTVSNLMDTDRGFKYNFKYLVRKLGLIY